MTPTGLQTHPSRAAKSSVIGRVKLMVEMTAQMQTHMLRGLGSQPDVLKKFGQIIMSPGFQTSMGGIARA